LTVAAACRQLAAERPAPLPGTTGSGAQQQGATVGEQQQIWAASSVILTADRRR